MARGGSVAWRVMAGRARRFPGGWGGVARPGCNSHQVRGVCTRDDERVNPHFSYPAAEPGYPVGARAWDGTEAVWRGKMGWEARETFGRSEVVQGKEVKLGRVATKEGKVLKWGCELQGIKLSDPEASSGEFLDFLADLIHQYQLVLLRRQGLTPARQVEIAKKLGPRLGAKLPVTSAADNGFKVEDLVPGLPEISCLGMKERGVDEENMYGKPVNNSVKGVQWPETGACSWHCDGAAFETPGTFTFVHMPLAPGPGNGGATLYASGYEIYESLPDDLKKRADAAASVRYISDGNWKYVYDMKTNGMRRLNEPGQVEDEYDHVHPLVVTHPVTNRKAVWSAPANVQASEDQDLVEACLEAGLKNYFTHYYDDGDVVISDDRNMLHSTTPFSPHTKTRILHRCGTELRSLANRHKAFQYMYDTPGAGLKGQSSFQPRADVLASN